MRALIISDIHANLNALETVLTDAGDVDATWCLGDLVGYGPDPNECVSRIQGLDNLTCILGNHDAAVIHQIDTATFNPEARTIIDWTRGRLTTSSYTYLKTLPRRVDISISAQDKVTLTHGSPRHPIWEYLLDNQTATRNFEYFDTPYCFVGHTHIPMIYHLTNEHQMANVRIPDPNSHLTLSPRAILNPGSVGQPRDRDPRAAYAIYDSDEGTLEYHRVQYDIETVQLRMRTAGLPQRHIHRLSSGM